MLIPTVVDKTPSGERTYDIYSRLLEDRIIFVTGEISDVLASAVIAQMLYLESKDSKKDINLYINSPGGVTLAGFAILDTMQYIKCDICTNCLGLAASAAALILAGGTKGKRFMLKNSKVMIHQPWGGVQGQVTEIEIYYKEGVKDKQKYAQALADSSGKMLKKVLADIERDNYMDVQEAIDYGLVDKILLNEKKINNTDKNPTKEKKIKNAKK